MGSVIQMFSHKPKSSEPFILEDVLTEEMDEDFHHVAAAILELWEAKSKTDFLDRLRDIKQHVSRWSTHA